jgi:hypothetical protein
MSWKVLRRAAALALAVVAIAGAGRASALTLVPPKPDVLFGISDKGSTEDFNLFTELMAKHPALLETFHPWGNSLNQAYERWRETSTRPIVAISTADDQNLTELITPEQIALGAGDDYLLQLNDFFAKRGLPASMPGRRSTATARRRVANTRRVGTSRPFAASSRSCAEARPWKESTRRWPKSGCHR